MTKLDQSSNPERGEDPKPESLPANAPVSLYLSTGPSPFREEVTCDYDTAVRKVNEALELIKQPLFKLAARVNLMLKGKPPSSIISDDCSGRFAAEFIQGVLSADKTIPLEPLKFDPSIRSFDSPGSELNLIRELSSRRSAFGKTPLIITESLVTGRGLGRIVEVLTAYNAKPWIASMLAANENIEQIRNNLEHPPGENPPCRHLPKGVLFKKKPSAGVQGWTYGKEIEDEFRDPCLQAVWCRGDINGVLAAEGVNVFSGEPNSSDFTRDWVGLAESEEERESRRAIRTYVKKQQAAMIKEFLSLSAD